MKKSKNIFIVIVCLIAIMLQPVSIFAEQNSEQIQREYLSDGSYYETTIVTNTTARSTIKNASKTTTYKTVAVNHYGMQE